MLMIRIMQISPMNLMNLIRSVNRYGAYMLFKLEKVVLAPISAARAVAQRWPVLIGSLLKNGYFSALGGQEPSETSWPGLKKEGSG